MQLFYAPDIVPPLHTLNEEESKHCIRVLRLQCGGRIHITDGRGNLFCCEITDDNPRRCTVRVVSAETGFEKLPYALTMAVAPTKNSERFEWFLEKATEVGVTADMIKPGAVVVDVGITRVPSDRTKSGWKLLGDVKFDEVAPKCSYITPVPGGVGPMTIISLMKNTLKAGRGEVYGK